MKYLAAWMLAFGFGPAGLAIEDIRTSSSTVTLPQQATLQASIGKTASFTATLCPGGTVTYKVTLTNESSPNTGVLTASIDDPIPSATTYVANSVTNGAEFDAGQDKITWQGALGPGQSHTFDFSVTVDQGVADGREIINAAVGMLIVPDVGVLEPRVELPVNVNCPPPPITLSLSKQREFAQPLCPGSNIAYTIRLRNTSARHNPLNYQIDDNVPANTALVPGSISGNGVFNAAQNRITWTGSLRSGQADAVGFSVLVNGIPDGTDIVNRAAATLADPQAEDSQTAEVQVQDSVACPILPDISKTAEFASPLSPESNISYEVTLSNTSARPGSLNGRIEDAIPLGTTYVAGSARNGANYDPLGNRIVWEGNLAAGQDHAIGFSVKVDSDIAAGTAIVNSATGTLEDPVVKDSATDTTQVQNVIQIPVTLDLQKSQEFETPLCPQSRISYDITLTNTSGRVDPLSAGIQDLIPNLTTYLDGSASGGAAFDPSTNEIRWEGLLGAGQVKTIGFSVVVDDSVGEGTEIVNRAIGALSDLEIQQTDEAETHAKVACRPIRPPIIFIPGIMGSILFDSAIEKSVWAGIGGLKLGLIEENLSETLDRLKLAPDGVNPNQSLDPQPRIWASHIESTYEPMIKRLEKNLSYRRSNLEFDPETGQCRLRPAPGDRGVDLFIFPYDWRKDLRETAQVLGSCVAAIRADTDFEKFIFVTHSMGGLLARYFMTLNNGDNKDFFEKLIMMGTPNLGSVDAFLTLVFGLANQQINKLATIGSVIGEPVSTALHDLLLKEIKDLTKNFPSMYQLLPNQAYFSEIGPFLTVDLKRLPNLSQTYFNSNDLKLGLPNPDLYTEKALPFWNDMSAFNEVGVVDAELFLIVGRLVPTPNKIKTFSFVAAGFGGKGLTTNIHVEQHPLGDGRVHPESARGLKSTAGERRVRDLKVVHGTMPQDENVQSAVESVIRTGTFGAFPDFPFDPEPSETIFLQQDPVEIHVFDSQGAHLGVADEAFEVSIPDSSWIPLGNSDSITLPARDTYRIELRSTGGENDFFDCGLESLAEDGTVRRKARYQSSMESNSKGEMNYDNTAPELPNLLVDMDGDGIFETKLQPVDITPQTLDFGQLETGRSKSLQFTLYNPGGDILSGSVGQVSPPFSAMLLNTESLFFLEPDQQVEIEVQFSPEVQDSFVGFVALDLEGKEEPFLAATLLGVAKDVDSDSDGLRDVIEDGAPNNGDGNGDGIADREQSHVASLPSLADSRYVTLESSNGTVLANVRATGIPSLADAPPGVDFPVGFFDLQVLGLAPGGNAKVSLILPQGVALNSYYKFGPTPDKPKPHWYEFLFDGTTGAEIFQDRVVLHFVDGQRGDDDLLENGEISEPGGPALQNPPFYFPQIGSGTAGNITFTTTLIFSNTGQDSNLQVSFFDSSGNPIVSTLDPLGTKSSFRINLLRGATFSSAITLGDAPRAGYAQILAGSGVGATAVFTRSQADSGIVLYEAGVPATRTLNDFSLAVDSIGSRDTGLAIVFPQVEPAPSPSQAVPAFVSLRLYDQSFGLIATRQMTLEPGTHLPRFVFELFPDVQMAREMEGSLTVESDQPLAAVTLRTNDDSQEFPQQVPTLTAFPVIAGRADKANEPLTAPDPLVFYFPQVGAGTAGDIGFETTLVLVNTGGQAMVKIEFFDSAGNPLSLTLDQLGTQSVFDLDLGSGAAVDLHALSEGDLQVGYARVSATSAVGGTAVFSRFDLPTGTTLYEAGVAASTGMSDFSVVVDSEAGRQTGLALVNTSPGGGQFLGSSDGITAMLRLYDQKFNQVSSQGLSLGPGVHLPRFVFELFPETIDPNEGFQGSLTVESNQPLAAVTLRQDDDPTLDFPQEVPTLATFPVITGRADLGFPESSFSQLLGGDVLVRLDLRRHSVAVKGVILQLYSGRTLVERESLPAQPFSIFKMRLPMPSHQGKVPVIDRVEVQLIYQDGRISPLSWLQKRPILRSQQRE